MKLIHYYIFRTVHNQCQSQLGEICDFGEFRHFIVRPHLVTSKLNRTVRHPKQRVIDQVQPDQDIGISQFDQRDSYTKLLHRR